MKTIINEKQKYFLKLNDIDAYKHAFQLSNEVWDIVLNWDYFAKDTIGKQFVRSIDSISANIAEGFGRYSKKDKIRFYRISKGSIYESQDWSEKSRARKILSEEQFHSVFDKLDQLPKLINQLIKYTNLRLQE
ncbi:MAG: four helix bundle protein [Bacteroidales bacterium]|nr:four helix bundle protein [Bacteroidales bacterium]MCF8386266.1 four helix bundle protein [Bacteroidales bacterium]MCF8397519.1 four helix bundle protein [Bacteroidales bacterium]